MTTKNTVGVIYTTHSDMTISPTSDETTVLEQLEDAGIVVEYQCRQGYCGSCRLRLTRGIVEYSYEPMAFIADGEFLPCCCFPKGDIEVEV